MKLTIYMLEGFFWFKNMHVSTGLKYLKFVRCSPLAWSDPSKKDKNDKKKEND